MKKVAFFTEAQHEGLVPRNHPNARTDIAWQIALQSYHINIGIATSKIAQLKSKAEYFDIGIIILPKNIDILTHVITNNIVKSAKQICTKVAIMQEGPHWFYQDYNISLQQMFYSELMKADFILCHNSYDVFYYRGITGKPVYKMQSLMIEDSLLQNNFQLNVGDKENLTMIGGNFVSWYSGFDSFIVAREFEGKIFAPTMGRKQKNEEYIKDLNLIPYQNWTSWIFTLNEFKYGVHMMRTFAAGTFALNCAYLGIPCIGYLQLDTQSILHHPILTVELGDIYAARKAAKAIKSDKILYEQASESAKENYKMYYSENKFKQKMEEIFENELSTM